MLSFYDINNIDKELQFIHPKSKFSIRAKLVIKNGRGYVSFSENYEERLLAENKDFDILSAKTNVVEGNGYITLFNCKYRWPFEFSFDYALFSRNKIGNERKFLGITCNIPDADEWLSVFNNKNFDKSWKSDRILFLNSKRNNSTYSKSKYIAIDKTPVNKVYKIKFDKELMIYLKISVSPYLITGITTPPRIYNENTLTIYTNKVKSHSFYEKMLYIFNDMLSLFCSGEICVRNMLLFDTKNRYNFFSNNYSRETEKNIYPLVFFMDIKNEMESILQKWFDSYDDNRLLLEAFFNYKKRIYSKNTLIEQIRAIEAYGNRINKGSNTKNDIKTAIFSLSKDDFAKIFHTGSLMHSRSSRGRFLNKFITQEELSYQISVIRNYLVHPFVNGSEKNPKKTNIHKIFIDKDDLNYSKFHILIEKNHNFIHFLLFKEIGLEKFWR